MVLVRPLQIISYDTLIYSGLAHHQLNCMLGQMAQIRFIYCLTKKHKTKGTLGAFLVKS
jgi:hypothetical protein